MEPINNTNNSSWAHKQQHWIMMPGNNTDAE